MRRGLTSDIVDDKSSAVRVFGGPRFAFCWAVRIADS